MILPFLKVSGSSGLLPNSKDDKWLLWPETGEVTFLSSSENPLCGSC